MTILEQLNENKQDIIKMYETMSMKDIAIKYNVHIQDISNFLKLNNIPKKKRISPKWSESRRNKFINTFNSKSEEEKENIKQKRANTNLQKFRSITNLQSKEMIEERIKKYGGNSTFYSKEVQNQIKQNNAGKHNGLSNPFQWEETKSKIKQTNLDRYGDENYHNVEKIKQTNLDRYGVESYMSTQEFREKSKQTCLKKYGKEIYSKTEDFKNKFSSKYKNKTGYNFPMQNPETLEKSSETINQKYGVNWNCQREEARKYYTKSKINLWWKDFLNLFEEDMEFNLGNYSFDLKKDNVLIEINPSYTHNSTNSPVFNSSKSGKPLDPTYHYNKSKFAKDNNYKCIMIWDWDNPNKIKNLLNNKESLYARNLIIKEISKQDTDLFLNNYHLQNTCKNQEIRLGLYTKDTNELIQLITFGKPRYNKNYEYELLRLCTKSDYIVVGGSEKLFKYFITNYKPKSIISYCDNSKFSGNVYNKLGFKLQSYGNPSKHWYNIKTKQHFTNNLLIQQGADRLLGTKEGKESSNEKIMFKKGFVEIYDCGQSIYTWK